MTLQAYFSLKPGLEPHLRITPISATTDELQLPWLGHNFQRDRIVWKVINIRSDALMVNKLGSNESLEPQ